MSDKSFDGSFLVCKGHLNEMSLTSCGSLRKKNSFLDLIMNNKKHITNLIDVLTLKRFKRKIL